jgi:fumarylacetoacetase
MKPTLDHTHDPKIKSWLDSANLPSTDFPLQNLPFGIFRCRNSKESPRVGVAIGDSVLDVSACASLHPFPSSAEQAATSCASSTLNALMALGQPHWTAFRHQLHSLLRSDASQKIRSAVSAALTPLAEAQLFLPAAIGDYTDFYASIFHATNVGSMFRPDNPLLPNYKYVPIGYHGRASSVVPSGTAIHHPTGQIHPDPSAPPQFAASRQLDYELEVGFFVGPGNPQGQPIAITEADSHIFGLCLLNDWSARDIQSWEYQPLGPFLSKGFATTISPWVVTLDALAPFRTGAFPRPDSDPQPLPYLFSANDQQYGGINVTLEVFLRTAKMRQENRGAVRISRGNFRDMYWTIAQMLTHHASNGCNLRSGDLLASGTVSGNAKDSRGCLLELTKRGTEPVVLPDGEQRGFLQDGDEVILRGYCERDGYARIGFGECSGTLLGS